MPVERKVTVRLAGSLLVLLLAAPVVAAAHIDAGFSAEGLVTFRGSHDLTWSVAAADLGPGGIATLDAGPVYAYLVNVPFHTVVLADGNSTFVTSRLPVEPIAEWATTGPVEFHVTDGMLRVMPDVGALEVQTDGTHLSFGNPGAVHMDAIGGNPYWLEPTFGGQGSTPPSTPRYTRTAVANTTGEIPLNGGWVMLGGGEVRFGDETIKVPQDRLNRSRTLYVSELGGGDLVYDNHFIALHVPRGHLTGTGEWHTSAYRVQGLLEGHAAWFGVEGDIHVDGDRAQDPTVLEIQGVAHVDGRLSGTPGAWRVSGQDAAVRADLAPLGPGVGAVAGSVGGLALLAAALAWLGRDAITFLLGRWTPPGVASDPLTSTSRRRILAAVHEHQPVRIRDLERLTGLSRGALRYHLRILQSTRILQHDASGGPRHTTFMLNGGSLDFRIDSGAVASTALSAANTHPVRCAVHNILVEGGLDQGALLEELRRRGTTVSRSTLSHHLSKMVRAGLVGVTQRGGRKHYESRIHPSEAQAQQYRSYLRRQGLLPAVRLLLDGIEERETLRKRLGRHGGPEADRLLRRLERLQLAHADGDRLLPAPFLRTALDGEAPP